ncbi:MAG: HAMP domain-containing sensor histidine kinase, partial [Myxococcota bacterium]
VSELTERWTNDADGLLSTAEAPPKLSVPVAADALARLVLDILNGYRRHRVSHVALSTTLDADSVAFRFSPATPPRGELTASTVAWLLVERSAHAIGARVARLTDGEVELRIPLQSEASDRPLPLERWPFGITFPHLPASPVDALRARFAIRLVWLSMVLTGGVGTLTLLVLGTGGAAKAAVAGWIGMLFGVLGLYRSGRPAAAGWLMAIGQVVALTVVQSTFGGTMGVGMVYFVCVAVLGAFITGSRHGIALTALTLGGIGAVASGDQLGLSLPAPPETRLQVAFVTAIATGTSAALVAMWATPFEALVASADDAAARASDADRTTSEFLDVVSIELRTPLNAILGYAEMLLEDPIDDPDTRGDLVRIVDAGRHLLAVVNDLLDMAAIVSDELEVEVEEIELAPLLASVTTLVRPMLTARGTHLELTVEPGVSTVVADRQRLRQVITNLLSNAAKFTSAGRVAVVARLEAPTTVVVDVEDTGIGIAAEKLEQLFQPFRQVHEGKQYGGTGLGLAISRRLVRKMNGDIDVRSVLGEGSVFSVTLREPAEDTTRMAS